MSIIVAVKGEGCVYLAADSQVTFGESKLILDPKHGKLRQLTPQLAVGCTGNMNQMPIVTSEEAVPGFNSVMECGAWIYGIVTRGLKGGELMEKNRYTGAAELPGRLLIAWKDDFIEVDASGQLIKPASDWHAIGSGAEVARGAMWSAWHELAIAAVEREEIARVGVNAACTFNIYCSFPVITAVTRV
jgi:ATP-dependent protease HslVU (ClpYQ) peptidase subunit